MGVCVSEMVLHEAWRRADGSRVSVSTADGKRYRVLYSGMPGGSYGPDFRDAVLERNDGSEVVGDVEIHRNARDWFAHKHDTDERYCRVTFHAVGAETERASAMSNSSAVNSLGFEIPELGIGSLIDYDGQPVYESSHVATSDIVDQSSEGSVGSWLDAMGDERFALKVSSMRMDIERFGPDLALQMAIFDCLGYPRNRGAFRHLAKRLPWAFLAGFARCDADDGDGDAWSETDEVARALELLRWGAGFGERPAWSPVKRLAGDAPNWTAAAGRPSNRPEARIVAAARLVVSWWCNGGPFRQAVAALRDAERSTFMRDVYRMNDGVLGVGRAGEIVVNAVLPLLAAWAEAGSDDGIYSKAMRIYRGHPSLPPNSVCEEAKRVLARRGIEVGRLRGARRQQGVMHIYRSMILRPRASRQMQLGHRALSS